MANTFKRATKSNLLTTDVTTDAATAVLTVGSSATEVILGLVCANKTALSTTVDVYLKTSSGDSVFLIKNAPVPAGSTFEYISANKLVLASNDVVRARANDSSAVDLVISYLEQT